MNKKIVLGGILLMAGFGAPGRNDAFACTTTAGCHSWLLLEDERMRRDGRMDQAMKGGQDNIEAFRRLREAEAKAGKR